LTNKKENKKTFATEPCMYVCNRPSQKRRNRTGGVWRDLFKKEEISRQKQVETQGDKENTKILPRFLAISFEQK
jgi:hypothetical protein